MQTAVILGFLLVYGWTRTIQALPVLPEPLYTTQENFDLARFLGTWYDVAVATTCTYMKRQGTDLAIGKLVLEEGTTEGKVKMIRSALRHGICKEMTEDLELTTTPGRFFYHIEKWAADVDSYVVHTNYDEYAILITSKLKSSGQSLPSVKLFSRTKVVRPTVLDDFRTLVIQQGMSDDDIIITQDKGDCVPGEQVTEATIQLAPQRLRRNVVPSLAPAEIEGSGVEMPVFNGSEACDAAPDTGPCFGFMPRYYYNVSSMSCKLFTYGGCLGNQNNFKTERECLQRCRTEAACRLPLAAEPCKGQPPIWAFDSSTGLCVPYKQGFCQTNANRFYSKAECEEYCGMARGEEELLTAY